MSETQFELALDGPGDGAPPASAAPVPAAVAPPLADAAARERFRQEWDRNFAVSANAGSGKTTAISERLAALALAPAGAEHLRRTAVVTYTKKAAAQISQRARQVLLRRLQEQGGPLAPLDQLERVFFGTIHSFCLKLAQTYGQTLGINLNPTVVAEEDEALWEAFLEQDSMTFDGLAPAELQAFLRHLPLDDVFACARQLDAAAARALQARRPTGRPAPAEAALADLLACAAKGNGAPNILASQQRARAWAEAWQQGAPFLPLYEPLGRSTGIVGPAAAWMRPLKQWLADAAGVLAGELATRYRAWRFARGVQTYTDQVDAAMAVLRDDVMLDRVRAEGWRVILDEAQDTDPQQFAVLVEITRPPGARRGTWPGDGATMEPGPRPGHFCMVGDGQQAIYGSRADIGNFSRHLEALRSGCDGEVLDFQVTFRAPRALIDVLNATLPATFSPERDYNRGLPPAEGVPAPILQVPYVPLLPGPRNREGWVRRLPLVVPERRPQKVQAWLAEEARQLAHWLRQGGPAGVGAESWGEVAILAPRNDWLVTVRKELEGVGLEVAMQTRRSRCGDNPPFAWVAGLLAVCADPENRFEWIGVLREVFGVSDGLLAAELRRVGSISWEQPEVHARPLAEALARLRPLILRTNDEGQALDAFAQDLCAVGALRAKAQALDPSGSMAAELERLLAQAAELGLSGGGPRDWLAEVLAQIDEGRATGKPTASAINLLTSHSAKGLEWPVVIPVGWWRAIGKPPDQGLKLVRDTAGGPRIYFDRGSLPTDTQEARERERVRELVRLLYVTVTRPQRALVLPWAEGFGGREREGPSFAQLWDPRLASWPVVTEPTASEPAAGVSAAPGRAVVAPLPAEGPGALSAAPALPRRVLPHELAQQVDHVRLSRHESALDRLLLPSGEEAIEYGLWWHETMERLPWSAPFAVVEQYGRKAVQRAQAGPFAARAEAEWADFLRSEAWRQISAARWERLAELAVFAPLADHAWVDGVVDLVLHDPLAGELRVVDWKTNRRRAQESAETLAQRLVAEYTPQLRAYGECLRRFFPAARISLWLYASSAGAWTEVG